MDHDAPARILFLDDDPNRAEDFLAQFPHAVWVQTAEECIGRLAESWDEVHLDHDLGGEIFVDSSRADCGMEVVRWLGSEAAGPHLKHAFFVVHTHNMNAAGTMVRLLREAGFETIYRPFGMDLLRWLEEPDSGRAPTPAPSPPSPPPTWRARLRGFIACLGRRGTGGSGG